uniref:sulfate ABC transporter permease subunit CysT n=1 Tax=Nocardia sp. XZ_19_385 TaxID=2769488 RepID=UPI00188E2E20|nr:sulfate ABC transporter permease subunit CysT [Nocardia sp. XZ_19_385]
MDKPAPAPARRPRLSWLRVTGSIGPLGIATAVLWLSIIVLLPLAALTVASFEDGWSGFWDAVTAPAALDSLRITVFVSVIVAIINVFMGTLIAWVLVRDDFPGKGVVNALIDLPFALPTIVASIVLLSLYGPQSPIDIHLNATQPGLIVALAFVTLPFVVRSVQPVLIEADREVEQAALSLGADNWTTFRRIVLPTLVPAIISGGGLAFARAIGEYGSVVLIGGAIPRETEMASQYIQKQIEIDRPVNAAAVSVALLVISLVTLLVLRLLAERSARKEQTAS